MKTKFLFWAVVAAMAVTGCSQNEVLETRPDTNRTIGFGVYTGTQTKGLVTDNATDPSEGGTATTNGLKMTDKGFGILAYQTTGNYSTGGAKGTFMDNVHTTWNATGGSGSGVWKYSPLKFWPGNSEDKLSFFAYAPYVSTPGTSGITLANATNSTDPLLTFKLQDNQKDMIDLVASKMEDQQQSSSNGKVTFTFGHMLTRVTMLAKTSVNTNAQTKVFITGIKLMHTTKLAQEATYNMHSDTWTLPQTSETTKFLESPYFIAATTANGVLKTSSTWNDYTTAGVEVNETASTLFTTDQYLFFIPIDGTGTTADDDVKAEISYDIVSIPTAGSTATTKSSFTKEVNLGTGVFAKGKAYKFTFTITLNAIEIAVTDNLDWNTDEDKPVTVN